MTTTLRKFPVASFYLLAIAIVACVVVARTWVYSCDPLAAEWPTRYFAFVANSQTYGNAVSLFRFALTDHWIVWSVFLFAGAPTLSAVVVAAGMGDGELNRLVARFGPGLEGTTSRCCISFYAGFFLLYFGIAGVYLLLTKLFGTAEQFDTVTDALGSAPASVAAVLVIGAIIDEGGLFEEIGWRGFALPHLLGRDLNPLTASILLGVLWWFWHFPREIPGILAGVEITMFVWIQTQFVVLCVSLSVLCTLGYHLTGGSIWPAILIHGGTNVWSKALSGPVWELTGVDLRNLIVLALAALVLFFTRGRLAAPPTASVAES